MKAAGLDGLSVEHRINCHPILPGILARLFNLIIKLDTHLLSLA